MVRAIRVGAVAIVAGLLAAPALAQGGAGVIAGTVVARESGRPVPEAVVSVAGSALRAQSTGIGRFRLDNVPAGSTVLTVRAQGFLDLTAPPVQVAAGQTSSVTLELELTPNFMERVQVTATKTPLRIGDLPAQTDIVDRAAIDVKGDNELIAAIANLPGVIVSGQAGSFDSVMLRGMPRDGNEFTTTLLLIDGIPQVDSRNSARVVNLPIDDAGGIEVLRGPNSALYGRTAIGGSVNVLTARPAASHQAGFDFLTGGFGLVKGAARATGPVANWGGYYVSALSEYNHGYYTGVSDFAIDETALFAKLTFAPDARSFGAVTANRVLSDNSTPTNVPIVNGSFLSDLEPGFDRLTNLNLPGPNYHQEEGRLTAHYTRQMASWAQVVGVFGYRAIQYKFIDDGDVIGSPFDLNANTLAMYPFELQTDEDIFYQEARVEMTPRTRLPMTIMAGGSYEHTSGFSAGNLIYTDEDLFGFPLNYLAPVFPPKSQWEYFRFGGRDYNMGVTGIFGQVILEPAPRWSVTAAGRYDRLDLDSTLTFAATRPRLEDSFDAFSPKVGAIYRVLGEPGRSLNAYGSYAQAFVSPRRQSDLTPSNVTVELQPEDIDNYEIGMKGNVLDGRVSLDAAWFYTTRKGIVTTVRQGPFFIPTNAGEHKYRGLELAGTWQVRPRASVYANAAFYRNRFGDFVIQSGGGDTVLTGNHLPISPDIIFNAGTVLRPGRAVDVTLDIKHVGAVQVDQGNTFELDPYTLVDASVSWRRGPLRLTLAGHNLFNEEYYWNGDTSSGESADPGRPRQIVLTTSLLFR